MIEGPYMHHDNVTQKPITIMLLIINNKNGSFQLCK